MKKISLFTGALLVSAFALKAQQLPLYSNYFFTPYMYNPALSGAKGVTEATVVHRQQWAGMPGAPETSAFGLNGALNNQKVGYSIYAFTDKTDIVQRSGIYASYAYHVKLADKSALSFGLSGGYLRNGFNQEAINVTNPNDPLLFYDLQNKGVFDLNFGINLKVADFNLGFAAPQLLGAPIDYSKTEDRPVAYGLIRHFVGSASYDFRFNQDKMALSPFVLLRVAQPNVPLQFDGGIMFNMKGIGYVGAAYRSDFGAVGNLGIHLSDQLTVGYAYDYSTNTFASALGGSHEMMLQWRFGSNKQTERIENEIKKLKADSRSQREQFDKLFDERVEEIKEEMRKEARAREEQIKKEAEAKASEQATQNAGNNQQVGNNVRPDRQGGGQKPNTNASQPKNNTGGGNNQMGGGNAGTGNTAGGDNAGYSGGIPASQVEGGSKGFYVVAGVFGNESNARRQVQKVENQGFEAGYFRDASNNMYYVYLFKFGSYRDANNAKNSNLNGTYNGSLWVKVVE